jgi:hypothetical protein
VDSGNINLSELASKLETAPTMFFRMALKNTDGQWLLHTLMLDVLPEEAGEQWSSFTYDYGRVAFLGGIVTGREASDWLQSQSGQVSSSGEIPTLYSFHTPQWFNNANWRKYRSYQPYDLTVLSWPYTRYEVSAQNAQNFQGSDTDLLVSEGCPFFPNLQLALAQLVYGVKDWENSQNLSSGERIVVRIAQTEAWIQGIHLSPATLTVTVAGTNIPGSRLEIIGPPERLFDEVLKQGGAISCPLPEGPPSRLWIVLSRSKEWLDFYQRDERFSHLNREQSNVTIEQPDPRVGIEGLLAQGEGPTIEFKREIPQGREGESLLKTVAAFANGEGGIIFVGIDNDGAIVGIADVNRERDRITDMIRRNVVQEPPFHLESHELEGMHILTVQVWRGAVPPFGVHPYKPLYYVRRGATTFPARQEEVRALAQAGQLPSTPLTYGNME